MVTSDFINPISTINGVPGDPVLRGSLRVWDLASRSIVRSIFIPTALGTMDVRLIPKDKKQRAFTAGMFDGLIYLADTQAGTAPPVFDTKTINGRDMNMPQVLAITHDGDRLIFPLYGTGQIVMLDISKPDRPELLSVVDLGSGAGPHDIALTNDDKRLIVTNYFVLQDDFGQDPLRWRPQDSHPEGPALEAGAGHGVQPRLQHRLRHRPGPSARNGEQVALGGAARGSAGPPARRDVSSRARPARAPVGA